MRSYEVIKINTTERSSAIYCEFCPVGSPCPKEDKITLVFKISDFYDAHLKQGKIISDEEFERLYEISNLALATVKAEQIISRGQYSKKQLVQKLQKSDIERQYAEKAADIMEEKGYINEEEQAKRLAAAYCRRKYWGKSRIILELYAKGYNKSCAVNAAGLISKEEYENALQYTVGKKYPDPPADRKEKEKRISALMRLGFSPAEINAAFIREYEN